MTITIQTSIDNQGRIVIPSSYGNKLGLSKGMKLIVEEVENNQFCLRIQKEEPILVDKQGILVVKSEAKTELIEIIQRERDRRILDFVDQAIHESIT